MFNIPLDKYIQAFDETPKELKDVLFADYTSEAIKNSAHRHNAEDKLLDISATIGYVLVGLIPIKNMIQIIHEEADLDINTAKNIAYEIREQLFGPIAQALATIQPTAYENWQEIQSYSPSTQPVVASANIETDHSVVRQHFSASNQYTEVETGQQLPMPPSNLPTGTQMPTENNSGKEMSQPNMSQDSNTNY